MPADYVLAEDFSQLVPVLHGPPPPGRRRRCCACRGTSRRERRSRSSGSRRVRAASAAGAATSDRGRSASCARPSPHGATSRCARRRCRPGGDSPLPVRTHGDDVAVRGIFRSPLGDYESVPLGQTNGRPHGRAARAHPVRARVARAGRARHAEQRPHLGERGHRRPAERRRASSRFGTPRVDGQRRCRVRSPTGPGTGGISGAAARLGYVLTPDRTAALPPAPADRRDAAAACSRRRRSPPRRGHTASSRCRSRASRSRRASSASIERFPSIVGDAVVADRDAAATMLDTRSPGLGTTDELWLEHGLRAAHVPQLLVQSRAETLARLQADPLARGALLTLAGTAAVALLLALVGLLLARRRRRARRARRAVRPRGAGRRAGDDPRAPASARAARGGVRRRGRRRARRWCCRRS